MEPPKGEINTESVAIHDPFLIYPAISSPEEARTCVSPEFPDTHGRLSLP